GCLARRRLPRGRPEASTRSGDVPGTELPTAGDHGRPATERQRRARAGTPDGTTAGATRIPDRARGARSAAGTNDHSDRPDGPARSGPRAGGPARPETGHVRAGQRRRYHERGGPGSHRAGSGEGLAEPTLTEAGSRKRETTDLPLLLPVTRFPFPLFRSSRCRQVLLD